MTIKMRKHNLYSIWQIVFMNDTDKQMPIDLYQVLVTKNLNGVYQIF